MTRTIRNVRMNEDANIRVNGTDYDLKKGDLFAIHASYARKMTDTWGIAEITPEAYNVLDENLNDEIGVVDGDGGPTEDSDDEDEETDDADKMIDNYLSQNAKTVAKEIREDDLSDTTLAKLRDYEEQNENRKTVLKAIDKTLADE